MYASVCVDIMGCLPPDLFVCARERGVCGVRRRERGDDVVRTRYHKKHGHIFKLPVHRYLKKRTFQVLTYWQTDPGVSVLGIKL